MPVSQGVTMIAAERRRQIEDEGHDHGHDDDHTDAELPIAAAGYLRAAIHLVEGMLTIDEATVLPGEWEWAACEWKPSPEPIRNLVKAGALIAAEIDRLRRADAAARVARDNAERDRQEAAGVPYTVHEAVIQISPEPYVHGHHLADGSYATIMHTHRAPWPHSHPREGGTVVTVPRGVATGDHVIDTALEQGDCVTMPDGIQWQRDKEVQP